MRLLTSFKYKVNQVSERVSEVSESPVSSVESSSAVQHDPAQISQTEGSRKIALRGELELSQSLRITEIFHSLQGETDRCGLPTIFVRLTGCPLRCRWCDSAYAFEGGQRYSLEDVMENIAQYQCQRVCVTGGEPLAQPGCLNLLSQLCDAGYDVSLETSGALDIGQVDSRVMCVLDLKPPDSDESHRNRWDNMPLLAKKDVVKFVLASRADFEWALDIVDRYSLNLQVKEILFSPVYGELAPENLAQWLLESGVDARLQVQLHKILWGERPGV